MKFTPILVIVAIGVVVVVAIGFVQLPWQAKAEFSFDWTGDGGGLTYRCRILETPEKTEANARAAHDFFAPALSETIRLQAEAMARSMSRTRPSSEIISGLEEANASAEARLRELSYQMRSRFGCAYGGSFVGDEAG